MPPVARTLRVLRAGLGPVLAFLLLLAPLAARAQDDSAAIEKITTLNKKALDAYDNLEFEDARKLLKQALDLCTSAGLDKHPIAARTHVHMGVVLIAAKQQELGIMSPEVKARLVQAHSVLEGNGDLAEADDAPASPPGQTALFNSWEDAIECAKCGGRMVRTGSCYTCRDCGQNTGCS